LNRFLPIFETGRSLGLRAILGLQNFDQFSGEGAPSASLAVQLRQLAGVWLAFHLDPGPDAKIIAEGRLTKGQIRIWEKDSKTGEAKPGSKDIPILEQGDLVELRVTATGRRAISCSTMRRSACNGLSANAQATSGDRPVRALL
jgi:hypothetical protein